MYVVDSIVRGYQEGATNENQTVVGPESPEGTYAGGFYRISQVIMNVFADIFAIAPNEDVKVRMFCSMHYNLFDFSTANICNRIKCVK